MTPTARTRTVAVGIAVAVVALGSGCAPKPRYRSNPWEPGAVAPPPPAERVPAAADGSPRDRVETAARPWLGTPYRYGGVDARGIDCSALAQNVPGDLVFFRLESGRTNHVGIALDANRFVHASSSRGVVIDRIMDPYFARRVAEVRRVWGETGESP